MHLGILITALFLSNAAYADALIISAVQQKNSSSPTITLGFSDSSFDYDSVYPKPESKTYCFVGNVADVCPQIQREAREMQMLYSSGAHDNIQLHSCSVETDSSDEDQKLVRAVYTLSDDYTKRELKVNRKIKRC